MAKQLVFREIFDTGADTPLDVCVKSITFVSQSTDSNGRRVDNYRITMSDGTTSTFSITNGKDGTNGTNGKDGTNGTNGKDGVSPTINVSKSGSVTTITITDANGTKTATINDGTNGTNGTNGKDGKTPVKGTDYFTSADKTEMVNAVISALPKYNGGVS